MTKKVLYVIVTVLFVASMLAACAAPTAAPAATQPQILRRDCVALFSFRRLTAEPCVLAAFVMPHPF